MDRVFWGRLRRDTFYIFAYFLIGVSVLSHIEDFTAGDAVYFLATTVTTVGYGDIVPHHLAGKYFMLAWMPLGISMIFTIFVRYSRWGKLGVRRCVLRCLGVFGVAIVDVRDYPVETTSPEEMNRLLKYWFRYAIAAVPSTSLFLLFAITDHFFRHGRWGDSWYFAMATCTTVGYGDRNFSRESAAAKCCLSAFIVVFVCVFGDFVTECAIIRRRQALRNGEIALPSAAVLEALLLAKARAAPPPDGDGFGPEPYVSESDYILATLSAGDLVDAQILLAIRRAYHWTAVGSEGQHITPSDVHACAAKEDTARCACGSGARLGAQSTAAISASEAAWRASHFEPALDAARREGAAARARDSALRRKKYGRPGLHHSGSGFRDSTAAESPSPGQRAWQKTTEMLSRLTSSRPLRVPAAAGASRARATDPLRGPEAPADPCVDP